MMIPRFRRRRAAFDPENPDQYFQTTHLQGDLKRRTVRGGAATVFSQIAKQMISIVSTVVFARLLSPQDNGLIAMVLVVTGFIDLFSDLGLSAATIQRADLNQRQVSTLFWINVLLGGGLAVLTAASGPLVAWFYSEPRLTLITGVIAATFLLSSMTIQHRALLRRQMRFMPLVVVEIVSSISGLIVGIGAALYGLSYWSLVWMRLAAAVVQILGIWIVSPWRPGLPSRASGVRDMLIFGSNTTGFQLVNYVARNLDNLLIGRFYGPQQLGFYSKAYNLLLLPLQRINVPVNSVALPALSRLVDAPERYKRAYQQVAATICITTMPLVAYMIVVSDWLVVAVLTEKWAATSSMFAWLGLSGLIEPISSTTAWLFVTQARTREQFHWGIIGTTLTVAAILLGLPWGPVGVAASYGVTGLLIRTPLLFWFVGRSGPVRTRDLYRIIAPFAAMTCLVLLVLGAFRLWGGVSNPWAGLVVAGGLTGLTTLLALACFPMGRQTLRDLQAIPALMLKRKGASA